MSFLEMGIGFLRELRHIKRPKDLSRFFRFIRTKNRIVRKNTVLVYGHEPIHSPCLISLGRDEEHLSKAFLTHYKSLGFKSFIYLDNNSKNCAISHLVNQAKILDLPIRIYRCNLNYRYFKHSMKNFLISLVPQDVWTFYADCDEFLILPDGVKDLGPIISYLDSYGYNTVRFHMLDMFSSKPFSQLENEASWDATKLALQYPYYDISTLESSNKMKLHFQHHSGGIRLKNFGISPHLTKVSFFKKVGDVNLKSSHKFLPTLKSKRRNFADFSLFVKHYKFNSKCLSKLERAVHENSYYDNSKECHPLYLRIKSDDTSTLKTNSAQLYRNCEQLRAANFIIFSERFQNYLR